jgi:hypothetical protein
MPDQFSIRAVIDTNEIIKQRADFNSLLQSPGQASFSEIEKIMQEREVLEPEAELSPEIVKQL